MHTLHTNLHLHLYIAYIHIHTHLHIHTHYTYIHITRIAIVKKILKLFITKFIVCMYANMTR